MIFTLFFSEIVLLFMTAR